MAGERQSASVALTDIIIIIAVSSAAYFAEVAAREAGYLKMGADSQGFTAVLAGAATALLLVIVRGQHFRDIGFRRPRRWATVPLWAIGIMTAYFAAQALAPILISSFMELPRPDFSRYGHVYQNLPAALTMALVLPFTASIPEEIIYRGFLFDRLTSIFGSGVLGSTLTVLAAALIFGAIHFQWGLGGVLVTSIMGLVWGVAFLLCGRNLWIVIIAHSLGHILFVTQLYFMKIS